MFNKEENTGAEHNEEQPKTEVNTKSIRPIIPEIKALETPFIGSAGALILMATIIVLVGTGILFLFNISRDNAITEKSKNYQNLSGELNNTNTGGLGLFQKDLQEVINGQNALKN